MINTHLGSKQEHVLPKSKGYRYIAVCSTSQLQPTENITWRWEDERNNSQVCGSQNINLWLHKGQVIHKYSHKPAWEQKEPARTKNKASQLVLDMRVSYVRSDDYCLFGVKK